MISEKYETIFVGYGSKLAAVVNTDDVHNHLLYIVQEKSKRQRPKLLCLGGGPRAVVHHVTRRMRRMVAQRLGISRGRKAGL